jgi:tetraacyldisaccharide 4'-kinase
LRNEGFRPVVLSRGYRRTSSGVLIVSRGDGPVVPWSDAGDEPFLIARRTPGAAVVVGADRYAAGRTAEQENLGDLFILDDGFQHRRLHRDIDLVTIDPAEWAAGEKLLPIGRWREPKSAIARADAACIQEVAGLSAPSLDVPAFAVRIVVDGLYQGAEPVPVETIRGRAVVAFAGIAKPERFFSSLSSLGISPVRHIRFRNHHAYTKHELADLGGEVRITTEKDAVRIESEAMGSFLHLRISVKIPEFDRLMNLISSRLGSCN